MKNALIDRLAGHDLLGAVRVRVAALRRARARNAGLRNAIVMIGNTMSTMIGSGSRAREPQLVRRR